MHGPCRVSTLDTRLGWGPGSEGSFSDRGRPRAPEHTLPQAVLAFWSSVLPDTASDDEAAA